MSSPSELQLGETVATVEWLRGKRMISTFMRNAGLGIDKVGVKETTYIRYRPGEVVDEARVMRAVNSMIKSLDDTNHEWEISNPKIVSIVTKLV
jgi:predicted Zn-dependent protease